MNTDTVETKKKICYILGMRVDNTSYAATVNRIFNWLDNPNGRYICASNVHMCMETYNSTDFKQVVNSADLVVPDGRPLLWAMKALGSRSARHVRGSDLVLELCKEAEQQGVSVGLYGGTRRSLDGFQNFLKKKFPALNIVVAISPPFRPLNDLEDKEFVNRINASGVRILFIGLGCPKQEKWMADHKEKVSCVMAGVGAAFDFFSGEKKHAPRWMQVAGLEWLFRLVSEPRRLWKRYLITNTKFIAKIFPEIIRYRINSRKKHETKGSPIKG